MPTQHADDARRRARQRRRRVIMNSDCNDDPPRPATVDSFLDQRTRGFESTQVDAISYSTGVFGYHTHRSDLTEQRGVDGRFPRKDWVKDLAELGTDPLEIKTAWCREHEIEIFWSMRMNDQHDSFDEVKLSQWKKDHPELLVGRKGEAFTQGCWSWSCVNYDRPEVRERAFLILEDVCSRYEVDGVELDFFRHPILFRKQLFGEPVTQEQRDMVTKLMRRVRAMMDRIGEERGHPLLLAVRVPDSLGFCRGIGIDLARWLEDDLVDALIGCGYFKLEPWENLVALGARHEVPVYASFCRRRVLMGAECDGEELHRRWRGETLNAWRAGVDGIHTFNLTDPRSPLFQQIGDPDVLEGLDRVEQTHYAGEKGYADPGSWLAGGRQFIKEPRAQ